MKFKIVQLEQFKGYEAGIYSIYLFDEQQTLFDCFVRENVNSFKSEILDIIGRIRTINTKTGAREKFFKLNEGKPGDGVCALYDEPNSHLRLYCIRYGNALIILGSGGNKPKTIGALQEDDKLKKENYLLRTISELIKDRTRSGEIEFSEGGTTLTGDLEFDTDEE
ncbi:MAG: hypothetical protein AB2L24_16730 [Mangrovibacterium sp.]